MTEKRERDWIHLNKNIIHFRLPEDLSKEKLDTEAKTHNLKDRTSLIIIALRQFISPLSQEKNNNSKLKEDVIFLMDFFQKNKGKLIITAEDKKKIKAIAEKFENE